MKNQKSLTNKGFSLVELIIVVAIMAVLIGVLAPQYLRYVEKSRLQKDNTSISEIADVIKMMAAEETLVDKFSATGVDFTFDEDGVFQGCGDTDLNKELAKTIGVFKSGVGDDPDAKVVPIKLTSKTYTNGATGTILTLKASVNSDKVMTVSTSDWVETVGAGKGDKTF